ncbi:NifB/NifX family molybdenum-iron cluster-binding protein [Alkalibacter rhizosphaerae]|uniref:NifB/NifX family molybdenum-iron cluster-binding protein n=1 Tax=Alkalibacter rhizosphaerae TaxID=2815577 RepID=A0A974XNZ8_9FIRM|nr:NifB/NifX family molybdenum-iron cluster-binding protein [Alkalibacter rhizosphaerae]QSX09361.1 NifB/NifX family molybdenum-iron cluster-binding protein [Alkalibacter rhizosphaerae]
MKIAIPANEQRSEAGICPSFGRAPWYAIFDTLSEELHFMENTAANSPGGAGIKAAQLLVDKGVKAVLAPRCGENAAQVLEPAGIEIFRTKSEDMLENIKAFQETELDLLEEIHPGYHGK